MNIAIIIVSWNVREVLRGCLQSLRADGVLTNGALPGNRVIVVDSASSDGTPAMLRADFPDVELIACETNVGFVKGNNLALKKILEDGGRKTEDGHLLVSSLPSSVSTPYIWFLNPDTLVHPGATQTLTAFMEAHPKCGLCGPKLENADGSLQHGCFDFPGLIQLAIDTQPRLQARFRDTRLDGRYAPSQYFGATPFRVGFPLGAAMFARAEAIRQIGLLDEGYEMYSEEVDFAMRMARARWERWCVPGAVVTHFGGASSSQASARAEKLKWQSRRRYYQKFYPSWKRWLAERMAKREA